MRDVTIIGAGPAGSAAALLLARAGWTVTLIEQHRFPRDKVCGECLSALGVEVLARLGIGKELHAAGAVWLRRALIHGQSGQCVAAAIPRPMLGISRQTLDVLMLEIARGAGVLIRQPVRCEGIELLPAGVSVRLRDIATNTLESLRSSFVIMADGKSSLPGPTPTLSGDIGIKTHWTGVDGDRDVIELFGCNGCYGGLAAIENDRWNSAFSVPAERVKAHQGNLDALFGELLSENPELYRRLSQATRAGEWLASPLPRFAVRRDWPPRVIPIGNAAAALEPIGGEGMGLALRSAEIAATTLAESHRIWGIEPQRKLWNAYDRLWRTRRIGCRAAGKVISSTFGAQVALEWLSQNERMAWVALRAMGK